MIDIDAISVHLTYNNNLSQAHARDLIADYRLISNMLDAVCSDRAAAGGEIKCPNDLNLISYPECAKCVTLCSDKIIGCWRVYYENKVKGRL